MTPMRALRRGLLLAALLPGLLGVGPSGALAKAPKRASALAVSDGGKARPQHRHTARPTQHGTRYSKAVSRARKAPVQAAHATVHIAQLPLVVVDAGHGGVDAGAVGPSGTLEKTVTLATARELGRQLRATRRYRVLLTRDSDAFVPLPARLRIAIASKAALMISIHADASTNRRARGASVYVRPAQASGPQVAHLSAHRGNSRAIADALSKPGQPAPGSARLQLVMVDSLDDDLSMVPDPARQGRFYVLGALGIPSVLVETGFISNRQDEALLRRPTHCAVIARALRDAVDTYFAGKQVHPPHT